MEQHFDVIIVGGGMVGSALACGLADANYRIALIEQKRPPAFDPSLPPDIRVSAINLASEYLLNQLGAWSAIKAQRVHPYQGLSVWERLAAPKPISRLTTPLRKVAFKADEIGTNHLGHIIENQVVQRGILERAISHPNITFIEGESVRELLCQKGCAEGVILSNEQRYLAPLVVGADGALSQIRQLADLGLRQAPYSQHAFVISIAHEGAPQDTTWQAFTPHGPLAYLPLTAVDGQAYASLVWYDTPDQIERLLTLDDDALIAAIQQEFPDKLPAIRAITQKGSFPLIKRHAKRYVMPGLALIGDAAHTINPLAGQGVNLGFQDVSALLECLAEGKRKGQALGALETLQRYESKRRLDNLMMMTLMDGFYYAFSNDSKPLKFVRNLGLSLAQRLTPGKRKVLEYATGLNALPNGL